MNARLLNLERRAAKEKTENRSFRSLSKAVLDPREADDFAHEAHLKLVTILTEINDVKESFKLLANTSPDLLQPEGIPNFSNYVPYMSRLTDLEQRLSLLPGRDELEKLMSEVSNIKGLLEDVESPILRTPTGLQSAGLAEILQEIGTLKRQVSETKVRGSKIALFPTRDVLDIFPETPKSEVEVFRDIPLVSPVDNNTEMLKQAILTLQKSVAMKASKSEVEALFASLRLRGGAAGFDINVGSEGVGGVNDRLETLSHSIDTLRKELDSQQKALKSLDDHITTKDILHQENLTRFQSEITYQFQELYTKINTSADDPESIKSITGLKLVLMKLQKDLKDMKNDTEARRSSVYFSSKPPSNEETPREKDDNFRDLVLKHETLLKQLSVQIAKIYADFEETQVQIQRQNENLLSGSLKQMEELRNYVSSMMEKVSQGAKLSQNDLEKLNDVMSMLENKGDKAEIKTKVDKMELKRTHRILSKRIESLQGELKRTEALQQVPPTRDEALLIRTKLDHECLACGQEVPVFQWRREWQSRGKFPETKFRLGPGFSKILPVLKELSDVYMTQKVHQRTSSDGRFTPNVMERTYTPVGVNVPGTERAAHRVMTSNPGMRALHRRKESSGL